MQIRTLSFFLIFLIVGLVVTTSLIGYSVSAYSGYSMCPTKGIIGISFTQSVSDYKIGDIVSYPRGNKTISHRIVGTTPNKFIIIGDFKKIEDKMNWSISDYEFIPKEDILFKTIKYVGLVDCPNFYNMTESEVKELNWLYKGAGSLIGGLMNYELK